MTRSIDDDALEWAIRTGDPEFDDWDGFTSWLEADPAHPSQFEIASGVLEDAGRIVATLPLRHSAEPANDPKPGRRRFLQWSGGAVAAAILLGTGLSLWGARPQPYMIETAAGEVRTVALSDGSEIVVAGGSRLMLDRSKVRFAALEQGGALFVVKHDASAPFTVQAKGLSMTDLGTVFEVQLEKGSTRVAVSDGAVLVDPEGARLRLDPGQAVVASGAVLRREPAGEVGAWREGRLIFNDVTIGEVADALTRHLGIEVVASEAVASRPFSGTIDAAGVAKDPASLGPLLGVGVRTSDRRWVLQADR